MKKVQQKKTTSTKTKQSTASGKPPRPLADAPPAFWEGVKIATTEPSPRVDPWADAERRLFGKPNYHYEMNEASTEDMLRSAICAHGGEDTVTDAIITAADELYMVMNGIENAPDSNPETIGRALGAIERRLRITAVLVQRIQRLMRAERSGAEGTA